jgi:lysophospholipase L1-like esterase
MTRLHGLAVMGLAALLGACDNEAVIPPTANPDLVDPLFARYVAFGNSITAGIQSGGINDSTQRRAYPALLAAQMGTEFNIPLLNQPGCPPPFTNVFTQEVVGDPGPLGCALRHPQVPELLNNVAYPGAEVLEALTYFDPATVPSETDAFRTFLLGGQTEIQAARKVQPTFVTVWLGSNDVLGAILDEDNPGDPALVTSPADFAASYAAFMDSLDSFGSIQGAAVIGVPQAALAPYLTQGRVWKGFEVTAFDPRFQASMDSAFRANFGVGLPITANIFDVSNSCLSFVAIPGTNDTAWTSVPFAVGGPALALADTRAHDPAVATRIFTVALGAMPPESLPAPTTINCADDTKTVTANEILNMFSSVAQYNVAIEAEVTARGWLFLDPNPLLQQAAADTTAIRLFPAFPGTASPTITVNEPFGSAFSLDGVHPSSSTHVLVTGALIQAINLRYGTSIPPLN